jgi:hypothetical protein
MKIYTSVEYIWDDNQGKLVEINSESHEYNGDVARCSHAGGGGDIAHLDVDDLYSSNPGQISQMPTYTSYMNQIPQDLLSELLGRGYVRRAEVRP